jgi:hypothetical protein
MSGDALFRPKHYPARKPTDTRLANGAILNPPRMSEIGGMSSLHKGHYKNDKTLRKPGGTK